MKQKPVTYRYLLMTLGLVPSMVCMIIYLFSPDESIVHICTMFSLGIVLFRAVFPPCNQPNLLLAHGTMALMLVSAARIIWGEWLIQDDMVPITLEILTLSFSLFYLTSPEFYDRFFGFFRYKVPLVNWWATKIVAFLCGIHLGIFSLATLIFGPLSSTAFFIIAIVFPPLVYLLCILINYYFIKTLSRVVQDLFLVRIVPVCNGKIYVSPRNHTQNEPEKLDIPIEEMIYALGDDANDTALRIVKDYHSHFSGELELRFSLQHKTMMSNNKEQVILLYILPLNREEQIHFQGGEFILPQEIKSSPSRYSSFLQEEADHLATVAEMWKTYK